MPNQRQQAPPNVASERFDRYLAAFDDVFARVEQRECFRVYLHGLLTAPDRKNVEAIAAATDVKTTANLSQALQHFVTESPWDFTRVLARYRELLLARFRGRVTAWVVHDAAFLKKGRNSVGTQRQFARGIGRKANCQVAVFVGGVTSTGYYPLAARLYLPGYWLREHPELVARTVPAVHRSHATKPAIALGLLRELQAEGPSAPVVALDEGYATNGDLSAALAELSLSRSPDEAEALRVAAARLEWLRSRLGFDHFEGRTWVGWHHHLATVFAAAGYLLLEELGENE